MFMTPFQVLLTVVICEHIIMFIRSVIAEVIPDTPKWVLKAKARLDVKNVSSISFLAFLLCLFSGICKLNQHHIGFYLSQSILKKTDNKPPPHLEWEDSEEEVPAYTPDEDDYE